MKTIYLVRHGQSEGNASGVFQKRDVPLTAKGLEQAAFIARRAAKLDFDVIIASPLLRAKQTAAAIAEETGKPIEYSELFIERGIPSELRGKHKDDPAIQDLILAMHRFDKPHHRHSDEENFDDLKARASAALSYLEKRPEDNMLVVGHGFFTRSIIARVLLGEGITGLEFLNVIRSLRTRNTGLSVLHFKEGVTMGNEGPESPWQLLVWNDHAHLG